MSWIDLSGTSLRYEDEGRGPTTLLLIHEMGGTLESWDYLVPLLSASFRVIRYDCRGTGLSEKARSLTMTDLGGDAVRLLDALGVDTPVVPIGVAVGGALALHLAANYPQRVQRAIAGSPATGIPAERRQALLERADLLERDGVRAIIDSGLDRGYPPPLRGDQARFARTRAQRIGADPVGFAATMRMLAYLDMHDDLARIACPILLIAGSHDGDRPPAGVAAVAAQIKGATVKVLETGHYMAIQTPELVAAEIQAFAGH
jgi:3-oxoadipate enol-lactonase